MKISIIIPTFNSANTLCRTLDSIISQTFTNWEVLLMDGASTDNTIEIAKSYKDNRIRVFSEPDKGVYDAMNKGIDKAAGEWLYFLGSDDYLLNNEVLNQVFSHIPEKCDVFYGDVEAQQLDERHKGEWKIEDLEYNRCHQAIFYNQKVFRKFGKYKPKYRVYADHDMNLKWFLDKRISSKYYPILIAHYSDGGLSTQQSDGLFPFDLPKIVLRYGWTQLRWIDKKRYIDLLKQRIRFQIKWRKDRLFNYLFNRKK